MSRFSAIQFGFSAVFLIASSASAMPMFQGLGDLPGGTFSSTAGGISADGFTIVGTGTNPDGFTEAWIANIPGPTTGLLLGLGLLGVAVRRRV